MSELVTAARYLAALGCVLLALTCVTYAARGAASLDDVEQLAAFIDGAAEALLESEQIPGMTVSIVKDGRVLLARGYGFATREDENPVSAESTVFRIGSVSKLFVATAIMQLVEQGKLDLHTDVNEYLHGLRIPDTYPEPITLAHLMTHTAGFETASLDRLWLPLTDEMKPLLDELSEYLPSRVRPPGKLAAYSNHGTAVAALVVEQVSGQPFDDYLEQHIFEPLGMRHTTARQPVPAALGVEVSTGNEPADFFAAVRIPPAGSISSSATDMTRFMIAHLQLGRLGDARILEEETAKRMQEQLFTHDRRVSGIAHQFFERRLNGMRALGHGGGTFHHITTLTLLPEQGVGFFASVNKLSGAPRELLRLFVDRYYPNAPQRPEPLADAAERLERYTGWYRESRGAVTHTGRIIMLTTIQPATAGENGRLQFLKEEWLETEPGWFRRADGKDELVFAEGIDGRITHAFRGGRSDSVLVRQSGYEGLDVQILAPMFALLVLLRPFVYRPLASFRRFRSALRTGRAPSVWATAALRLAALAHTLCFYSAVAMMVFARSTDVPNALFLALGIGYAVGATALWVVVVAGYALWHRVGSGRERASLALTATAGIVMAAWIEHWNLLLHRF
ncbi:MAG: serine hydrolase domain-containing protein [Myxococcota bacterium]